MQKKENVLICKIIMLLLCLPFVMGQNGCPKEFVGLLDRYLGQGGKFEPADTLYVTSLSFMDTSTRTIMARSETATLINKAVLQGIHNAEKVNPKIKHNISGHCIVDNDENGERLAQITFDGQLTTEDKLNQIIQDMMNPSKVHVLVTGFYIDMEQTIQVRPYIIDKRNRNAVVKEATFAKADFVCPDPQNSSVKVLCTSAHEEIVDIVQELLETL